VKVSAPRLRPAVSAVHPPLHGPLSGEGEDDRLGAGEGMLFQYYPDTDMLYIKLADGVSTESKEATPGIVLDFDERNQVIGIELEDASKFIDLSRLEVSALPIATLILSERVPVGA
jgi:uncharacterized protein YuzE